MNLGEEVRRGGTIVSNERDIERKMPDVDYALSLIGTRSQKILEIACGNGRFLVPFAKAGHRVLGLDIDEQKLSSIGPKASGLHNIQWHKSDVVLDEWEIGFEVVLMTADILSHIVSYGKREQAQELVIRKAAKSLVPGGHVLIDCSTPSSTDAYMEGHIADVAKVREWLAKAGFVIENEWGDYDGHPISTDTDRAVFWAKKVVA